MLSWFARKQEKTRQDTKTQGISAYGTTSTDQEHTDFQIREDHRKADEIVHTLDVIETDFRSVLKGITSANEEVSLSVSKANDALGAIRDSIVLLSDMTHGATATSTALSQTTEDLASAFPRNRLAGRECLKLCLPRLADHNTSGTSRGTAGQ